METALSIGVEPLTGQHVKLLVETGSELPYVGVLLFLIMCGNVLSRDDITYDTADYHANLPLLSCQCSQTKI